MALSPKEIQQLIDRATDNPQSLVEWLGNGGLKDVLTSMNTNDVYRGIMSFADTSSMSLAGGGDSQFAVCENSGSINIYRYYPNVDNTVVGGVTSLVGGQWRPIVSYIAPTNTSNLVFSVNESVSISDTDITVSLPISIATPYTVYFTPRNSVSSKLQAQTGMWVDNLTTTDFQFRFVTAAPEAGAFLADILIIY